MYMYTCTYMSSTEYLYFIRATCTCIHVHICPVLDIYILLVLHVHVLYK